MSLQTNVAALDSGAVVAAAEQAARMIPPLWPLASSVAVNPFLGQTRETLADTGARLARVGGVPVTMPRAWYTARINDGTITRDDLAGAISASAHRGRPADVADLEARIRATRPALQAVPSIAQLAADVSGIDWPGMIADRFGTWAAAYFDEGQALWAAPRGKGAWSAWRAYATHDLTPEIEGLSGFGQFVADAPEAAQDAIARAVGRLGLTSSALPTYFHQLLLSLGGWSQFARYRLWQAELAGGTDPILVDLLAVRLAFEEALFVQYGGRISAGWSNAVATHAEHIVPDPDFVLDAILQEAAERATQRSLVAAFESPVATPASGRPVLQAAFCIDVRSEVFRRALESVDPSIRTLGFAGFFGVFAEHRRFGSDVAERRLPVLLNPTVLSCTGDPQSDADRSARYEARARRAWGRFKLAAVSSFAFVEAMGPVYVGKLLKSALGKVTGASGDSTKPVFATTMDVAARVGAAETVLRAMSLTEGFGRIVLLAGHGANVVNNPHASGLHCGACGGYPGDVNARLLAGLLNDPAVRTGLVDRGIVVPQDTLFVAALHDTTTDAVTLFEQDGPTAEHTGDLGRVREWLAAAGRITRAERALRLPRADGEASVVTRSVDWSEVRPEWGLAGCRAFIAAPRTRTAGRNLAGRVFLHDYEWRADGERGFKVLELIMTAPVVVASWISLQYYGSTVAPDAFGGGNKLLHNVVGGIGVLEGNGGNLRAGLPWQSVHDGTDYTHEPLRLSVMIEAPIAAMNDILSRHEDVRQLFDNRWLHLFAIDADGQVAQRYIGDLMWEPVGHARELLKAVA
jgi:hypothetical protein